MKPRIPGIVIYQKFDYNFVSATGRWLYRLHTGYDSINHFRSLFKTIFMGKFNQGIHGSFRGKVGKVADSSWIKMCHTYPWLRKKKCGTFYRGLNITGEYPDYSINYSKVWVSCGILNVATEAKATEAAGQVTFTWTDTRNEDSFGKPDDKAILVIYCEAQNKCIFRLRGLEGFIRDSYNHKDLKPSRFFQ